MVEHNIYDHKFIDFPLAPVLILEKGLSMFVLGVCFWNQEQQ